MSDCTRGVIVTSEKSFFPVVQTASQALNTVLTQHAEAAFPGCHGLKRWSPEVTAQYSNVEIAVPCSSDSAQLSFTFAGERRTLWLQFSCDKDHAALGPQSLSFSVGQWGLSELYVKTVLLSLSFLGPTYFLQTDARDKYEPLGVAPLTVLSAAALNFVAPVGIEKWGEILAWTPRTSQEWERRMGVSYEQFLECESFEDWSKLATAATPPRIPFLAEALKSAAALALP